MYLVPFYRGWSLLNEVLPVRYKSQSLGFHDNMFAKCLLALMVLLVLLCEFLENLTAFCEALLMLSSIFYACHVPNVVGSCQKRRKASHSKKKAILVPLFSPNILSQNLSNVLLLSVDSFCHASFPQSQCVFFITLYRVLCQLSPDLSKG